MLFEKFKSILEKTADIENIKNYEIHCDDDVLKGDGLLSVNYTGYVKNRDTGEVTYTYIKKMPPSSGSFSASAYFNENHFYSTIWPALDKFQEEKRAKNPFTNITKYYCGSSEPEEQYICMENLKMQNFDILDKTQSIDEDTLIQIFDKYGKFHALAFAFKDQHEEKYAHLVCPLRDIFVQFGKSDDFIEALKNPFKAAYVALEEVDAEKAKKVKLYTENIKEHFQNTVYKGDFSALTHGDCWSNNLLFKQAKSGRIDDIKFIDFQFSRNSSPIHDLAYFFYSGASKEDFNKLDAYLEIYHRSFSSFARELGSDPEKLLPLSVLKSEWKQHSLFGIFMGVLVWQIKLLHKDEIQESHAGDGKGELIKKMTNVLESETFKRNASDILVHAIEYDLRKISCSISLSYAYKNQKFENYSKMVEPLKYFFIGTEGRHILGAAKHTFSAAYNAVKEIDVNIAKKFQSIEENFGEKYSNIAK